MSQKEKLLKRLLSVPSDFEWKELVTILSSLGFTEIAAGKTGGSRKKFIHHDLRLIINLHKPHPDNILKKYALKQVIETLKIGGLIK